MIIRILGMEKLAYKCEADKIKAVGFTSLGLVDAGRVAEGIAANFPFQRPTGQLSARYTYLQEEPLSVSLFNTADYWRFVEYGTGIHSMLGTGRSTPWIYYVPSGPWQGFHRTSGQTAKQMLNNSVKDNLEMISLIVRDRVMRGLMYGA
jgi:hypothetical protein